MAVKVVITLAIALLVAANAEQKRNEQLDEAKGGLLSLVNLGAAGLRWADKAIKEHAFQTGELVGQRLAADQKAKAHSVESKMAAGREGLKDSVAGGVSLLQQGMHQVEEVAEDREVMAKAQAALAPVRANPEFTYFNSLLETFGEKADQVIEQGMTAAQSQAKTEEMKNALAGIQASVEQGKAEEQEKLEQMANDPEANAKAAEKIPEEKQRLRGKADKAVEKAGGATKSSMDYLSMALRDAGNALKAVTSNLSTATSEKSLEEKVAPSINAMGTHILDAAPKVLREVVNHDDDEGADPFKKPPARMEGFVVVRPEALQNR